MYILHNLTIKQDILLWKLLYKEIYLDISDESEATGVIFIKLN